MTDAEVYSGATLLGAVAGLRSMSSPAIVSELVRSGGLETGHTELRFLTRPVTMKSLVFAAVGELIADKLPFIPKRTAAPSLIWRAVSGGLSGAAIAASKKKSAAVGAALGAAAAVGATYAAYEFRRRAGERTHIPDPLIAIVEDAVVASCAVFVLRKLGSGSAVV